MSKNNNISLKAGSDKNQNKYALLNIAYIFCVLFGLSILSVSVVQAQETAKPDTNIKKEQQSLETAEKGKNKPFSKSLLFTKEEISAIQRALLGVDTPDDEGPKPPRVLKLSGLLYQSSDNWVIWLNGNRVTPERLLPEIIDIDVKPLKINLKWFDYGINDVISITLRPHQIYDIATGILLPG